MDIPGACPLRTKRRSWRAELPSLALLTVALALFQAPVARAGKTRLEDAAADDDDDYDDDDDDDGDDGDEDDVDGGDMMELL